MTKVTIEDVAAAIVDETYTVLPDGRTTICQLTMRNGFTVDGKSACVDKAEFNTELGNKYARAQAVEKVWMFLGYDLQNQVALMKGITAPSPKIAELPHVGTYTSLSVVHAVHMNRDDYIMFRGSVPVKEDDREGYLVEYPGGSSRHEGFAGFVSWAEKDAFEKEYTLSNVQPKQTTYMERLNVEAMDLCVKLDKLTLFMQSPAYLAMSLEQQQLLYEQRNHMQGYYLVLVRRLGLSA